jgi:predicted Fe-S protein YdhL (DUF1289 family)
MTNSENIVESPCVRNCCLNDDDVCLGCFRSIDEIKRWTESDNPERLNILQQAGQRREAHDLRYPGWE